MQLPEDLDELKKVRFEKMDSIRNSGFEPYPYQFTRSHTPHDIVESFAEIEGKSVSVCGRIMSLRRMGKASFFHVADMSGRIQIYMKQDGVGEDVYTMFRQLDIGDFVGVTGTVGKTKMGEISVFATEFELLSKSLRPLPIVKEKMEENEKVVYDKFANVEQRYRQRYVDLVVNPEVRDVFITRTKIIDAMRNFLNSKGFLEVETPILQPLYGGASARPFVTHHNTLDMDLFLRISNELYLKRLIVGGFDGVYEIGKAFRNEGMDRYHNPEFTSMELYVAYEDYLYMMDLVENMITAIALEATGSSKVNFQGQEVDLSKKWKRVRMLDAIEEKTGHDLLDKDEEEIRKIGKSLKIDVDMLPNKGKIIDEIFEEFVEPNLIDPTFVIDFPVEISPLAKRHRKNDKLVERFEPYIFGKEIGNAFSELNDPVDQRSRFEAQKILLEQGDDEAQVLDEDYIRSLEYAMPPTTGLGIGIDRLVMMLTDSPSIRDVVFFPHMRPEE